MAYESNVYSGRISDSVDYPSKPMPVRPEPESPGALARLGKASQDYAEAASRFIDARENLNDARSAWQECRDVVAKLAEAEGIS